MSHFLGCDKCDIFQSETSGHFGTAQSSGFFKTAPVSALVTMDA
jgi:hypothetical protein